MLKGFKEFLARGNIVDLSIAVVIGTAFTALVTKFTESIIQPLINRIGAGGNREYGILRISIGGGQAIDLKHPAICRHQLHFGRGGGLLPGRHALQPAAQEG
jgi:large-conductance mechanosensitive channel